MHYRAFGRRCALGLAALLVASCSDLLVGAPCEEDINCPNDELCVEGRCTPPDDVAGEGEGEDPCDFGDSTIEIEEDAEFDEIAGCRVVTGNVVVRGNVTGVEDMAGIEEIVGNLTINRDNISLDGLEQLLSVDGNLRIDGDFDSLAPLGSLVFVGDDLVLEDTDLVSFEGLTDLEVIDGDLELIDNELLASTDGLTSLAEIGGEIVAEANPNLLICLLEELALSLDEPQPDVVDVGGNDIGDCG